MTTKLTDEELSVMLVTTELADEELCSGLIYEEPSFIQASPPIG